MTQLDGCETAATDVVDVWPTETETITAVSEPSSLVNVLE